MAVTITIGPGGGYDALSLAAAEALIPTNPTDDYILEYQEPMNDNAVAQINVSNLNNQTISVEVAATHSVWDKIGSGNFWLNFNAGVYRSNDIEVSTNDVVIEDLAIDGGGIAIKTLAGATRCLIRRCLSRSAAFEFSQVATETVRVENVYAYRNPGTTANLFWHNGAGQTDMYHCLADPMRDDNNRRNYRQTAGTLNCYGCISVFRNAGASRGFENTIGGDYNVAAAVRPLTDSTAPGVNSYQNIDVFDLNFLPIWYEMDGKLVDSRELVGAVDIEWSGEGGNFVQLGSPQGEGSWVSVSDQAGSLGQRGLRYTMPGVFNWSYFQIAQNVSETWITFRFRVDAAISVASGDAISPLNTRAQTGNHTVVFVEENFGSWRIRAYDYQQDNSYSNSLAVTLGTWYKAKVHILCAVSGKFEFWAAAVGNNFTLLKSSTAGNDTSTNLIQDSRFGIAQFVQDTVNGIFDMDHITIHDSDPGEAEGTTPPYGNSARDTYQTPSYVPTDAFGAARPGGGYDDAGPHQLSDSPTGDITIILDTVYGEGELADPGFLFGPATLLLPAPVEAEAEILDPQLLPGGITIAPPPVFGEGVLLDPFVNIGDLFDQLDTVYGEGIIQDPTFLIGEATILLQSVDAAAELVDPQLIGGPFTLALPTPVEAEGQVLDVNIVGGIAIVVEGVRVLEDVHQYVLENNHETWVEILA